MVGGVLTLTSVGRQDSGQYICNATNIHGYSEAYTQMEVESESTTQIIGTDSVHADSLPLLMMRVIVFSFMQVLRTPPACLTR